ncbi:type II secretion system minor pseudopilin GspK [Variovorax sp. UMC13]|uniref:type II secretion system minor pseudopilin GspK n=1 Tax=Variovorax sp. UMC13 TaxID=1862326 RepID=UPI001600B07E|nr:type II secretion system minor pseudopilin GspK [Variovorax sp. UMC13]MBB1604533.1 general secretion pathway protein GspK [Variovorax sp. UMC13]
MNPRPTFRPGRQAGAALLAAMLTVTLVATFAAAALWQQWRATEVESAERARVQASWVLIGALDWSRLILREDGRNPDNDNLTEPWAVPLEEARLSSFLAGDKNVSSDALEGLPDAFLSGRIVDAQSKLNVMNLVNEGKPVPAAVAAFVKLFALLSLPPQEVATMTNALQRASPPPAVPSPNGGTPVSPPTDDTGKPLIPQQVSQLVWLGVSPATVAVIEPYVTVLPDRTPLNINTASAEALYASIPELDLAGAQRLVSQRARSYFRKPDDAKPYMGSAQFPDGQHAVRTNYFEVHGRLRLDRHWVDEHSLVKRNGMELSIVWRERGAGVTLPTDKVTR